MQLNFKKVIKHTFPNFVERYRVLKTNFSCTLDYWENEINGMLMLADELEKYPYDKLKPKKYLKKNKHRKHAVVEINNTCNLNCAMCQTMSATRKRGRMEIDLFRKILVKLSKQGIKTLALHTLGDPLANPRLPEIFEEIRRYNFKTSICTNGLLLDRHIDTLIEYMDICPSISFSIDGAKATSYEKIRVGGKFDNILKQLELSNKKLRTKGMSVKIQFMICNDNIDEIGEFICLFRKYVLMPAYDLSFSVITGLAPDNQYFHEANPFPNLTHKNLMCFRPAGDPLWVNVDGTVSACCRDYHGDLTVGNIIKEEYDDILNGKGLRNLQVAHEKNKLSSFPLCDSCFRPDKRLDSIIDTYVRFLIYSFPKKNSSFYQNNINRIIDILKKDSNFYKEINTLLSDLK